MNKKKDPKKERNNSIQNSGKKKAQKNQLPFVQKM